jgi:hypothetical protein
MRRMQSLHNNGSSGDDNRLVDGNTMGGGGDNNEVLLLSIVRAFCKLVERGYAEMVSFIATNCKLENMGKGKESIDDCKSKFGMEEHGTIIDGKGRNEKKKRPASGGEER